MEEHKCADYFIKKLKLKRHPVENGFMSDVLYQSKNTLQASTCTGPIGDCVQFLYENKDFAPWHRIKMIYQYGGPMNVYMVDEKHPKLVRTKLEPCEIMTIDAGMLFAAELSEETKFCLYTVFLCPRFNVEDCETGKIGLLNLIDNKTDKMLASKFMTPK